MYISRAPQLFVRQPPPVGRVQSAVGVTDDLTFQFLFQMLKIYCYINSAFRQAWQALRAVNLAMLLFEQAPATMP